MINALRCYFSLTVLVTHVVLGESRKANECVGRNGVASVLVAPLFGLMAGIILEAAPGFVPSWILQNLAKGDIKIWLRDCLVGFQLPRVGMQ